MNEASLAIILIASLLLLLAIGVPIAFSLSFVSMVGSYFLVGPHGLTSLASVAWSGLANFLLTPLPLFLLMGEFVTLGAIGKDLFDMAHKWLARLPGGLAVASIYACAVFGAMCGVSIGAIAAIGPAALGEMLKRGYDKRLALGAIASAGSLAMLIPPSAPFILYGIVSETSIGDLFIAGIFPGIVVATCLACYVVGRVLKNSTLAPPVPGFSWKERFVSLRLAWAPLLLILAVLGTIYSGIATPSESAAIGTLVAFLLCIRRKFDLKEIGRIMKDVALTTGMICMILVGASTFGYLLNSQQIPQYISNLATSFPVSPWVILFSIQLILVILGCFLDVGSIIMITMPIFVPIIQLLGFNLVWFGVTVIINMEIAVVTPPVGLNLYVLKGVSPPDVTLSDVIFGVLPYIFVLIGALVTVMVFPQISLWLPSLMHAK